MFIINNANQFQEVILCTCCEHSLQYNVACIAAAAVAVTQNGIHTLTSCTPPMKSNEFITSTFFWFFVFLKTFYKKKSYSLN